MYLNDRHRSVKCLFQYVRREINGVVGQLTCNGEGISKASFDDILNSHYSGADELAGCALLPHVLPHLEAPLTMNAVSLVISRRYLGLNYTIFMSKDREKDLQLRWV